MPPENFLTSWRHSDAGDPNDPDTDTPAVQRFGEPPRYRWHLGCILLKMPAISLPTGIDIDDPLLGGYTPWVIACCEACLGKAPAPISNADSLRALEVVHAIYDSEATPPLSVPTA